MRGTSFFGRLLLLIVALFVGGCAGVPTPPRANVFLSERERTAHNLRVFDRAWQLVNTKFFDAKFRGVDWPAMKTQYRPAAERAVDDEALYEVINSLLGELKESHNYAMTPQRRWEVLAKQQARIGLGLRRLDGHWVVTEVIPGSPAEAAEVRRGWVVEQRDGQKLGNGASFSLKEGQAVVYDFLTREDERQTRSMTARVLPVADRREMRLLADGNVYLRFDAFDYQSLRWLSEQLKTYRAAPAVVIDLRYNHGGLFYSLEFSLGEFFAKSVQVGTFVRRSGSEEPKDSNQLFSARYAGKVILLTDHTTASCAEILAHVLHYHQRAVLIGRPTAGAVVASRYFALPDGGMLQIAVDDFRGLDGKRLEGLGVKPDITVELKLSDLRAGRDPDLQAAEASLHSAEIVAKN
ncbi:MAG: S41 family peptidase [Opitutaceae bacterium]